MNKQICAYLLNNFSRMLELPLSDDKPQEDHIKKAEGFLLQCKICL